MAIGHGELRGDREGRTSKFLPAVEQITFNGDIACRRGQMVLYVTERAVFQLTEQGLELIEIAPGIDIQTQILDLIPFPIIARRPRLMNPRLYNPKAMGLAQLLGANVVDGCVVAPEDELERRRDARKRRRLSGSSLSGTVAVPGQ